MGKITYTSSGVDYSLLDPVKRLAQSAGLKTAGNLKGTGFRELAQSRGETAYLLENSDSYFALVEEGLGTKNLIADICGKKSGKSYYQKIAQDTVAAIVNDLSAVGARPLTVLAYWAAGDSKWWKDKRRAGDLIAGWKKACDLACVSWGGGETPAMNGIVKDETINLAGAAFGIIKPKTNFVSSQKIRAGDSIIIFESSGIHANGLSLARKIAAGLKDGYQTLLPNGQTFGEELLTPSIIYSGLINDLLENKIELHYLINITGHGWRKFMRANESFTYLFEKIVPVPEIFSFIKEKSGLNLSQMYGTFNMGAGFAAIVPCSFVVKVLNISRKNKIKAYTCGNVIKGDKQVIIRPLKINYKAKELNLR